MRSVPARDRGQSRAHPAPEMIQWFLALAVALAIHGGVGALLWRSPSHSPPAVPAVMVRLIEVPRPTPPAADPGPAPATEPRPPAQPRVAARPPPTPKLAPAPRPEAAATALPAPSEPAVATVDGGAAQSAAPPSDAPPAAAVPPLEPELAVRCPHRPPPVYPDAARRFGQEGVVELLVELSATGAVTQVTVTRSSGSSALDRAALDAVRKWRCEPARVSGVAVPATASQRIRFSLR